MNPSSQVSAIAASDAYLDRSQGQVNTHQSVQLSLHEYTVFGYKDDPSTGFHATAYQDTVTGDIIIAYRGTDPDIKHHTRTTVKDALVDATMVKDTINPQEAAAHSFTQDMIDKAQRHGISKDRITVAGHSLGGTLAEIEAWKFGLRGTTLNAYGAVDLGYGIPPGGSQVTDYVMAGDVVSAASRHFGHVVPLASQPDVDALHAGRYLGVVPGAPPPNPLLAMRPGDHSSAHFTGADGMVNVLAPTNLAAYEARYARHRAAFDHFRGNVQQERADLAVALNDPGSRNIETTLAHLSPQMRQQLAEYHAVHVDAPIQNAVEHNRVVQGIEQGLDQTATTLREGGLNVQQGADHLSQRIHVAGQSAQQQADAVSRGAQVLMPINPLAASGMALGATATGYLMRAEIDSLAGAGRLVGQVTDVGSQWVADRTRATKHTVEEGAHVAARLATVSVHAHEATLVTVADRVLDDYRAARATGEAIRDGAVHVYDATRQAASQGIEATEHAAGQAYDMLTRPGQRFHRASPETSPVLDVRPPAAILSPPLVPPSMRDFRHPEHPLNARYQMFRDALGEQGFHQDGPTLNAVPEVRSYSTEQKDRLAAGFTAKLGADHRFNTEIHHFGKSGDALLAVEHPQRLGDTPLVLAIPEAQTLARTPEAHAATWRARELPAPQAVNTARPDSQTLSPDHPGHPEHPHHTMFEHAREALTSEYARWGIQKEAEPLDRETMQVMIAARDRKMDDVGAIRLWKGSPDGRIGEHPRLSVYDTAHGPQQSLANPGVNVGFVESETLQHAPPMQQAAQQLQAVDQQVTQQIQQTQQWQAQVNAQAAHGPAMGGLGIGR